MDAITGAGAAQAPAALSGAREAVNVQKQKTSPVQAPAKPAPVMDEYVPEEEHTPSGLYWIGRDEDGAPKVYFDDPEGKPAETCTINTDRVDRELEQLRSRAEELEQRLAAETDEGRAQELERRLTSVESELTQKDNDVYRRQNAVIS